MGKFGVDISNHNGDIIWNKLSKEISFAIIRAGYGQNNIDERAIYNIEQAQKYGVPFGLYWFSYALSVEQAKKEANFLCDIADKCNPTYPLCYDWEYDSDKYARRNGADTSKSAMLAKATAFLSTVERRGYYAMLYTNLDYLNRGFGSLTDRFDIWLAQWGTNFPSVSCGIWQTTSNGMINGIVGNVDKDISYKDYPAIIARMKNNSLKYAPKEGTAKAILDGVAKYAITAISNKDTWNKYIILANEIIAGKYGKGEVRKAALTKLGYNYDIAQIFVTELLKQ